MTEQVRYRIKADLVREAGRVCDAIGLSPSAAVSLFFAQMVKAGGLPFRPSEFPALDEYGVTAAEAEAGEAATLARIEREERAGKLKEFTGTL